MVRMAQEFSMRYMLVNGQGNFGSIDGDNAAAYRYTEAKMQKMSEDMLLDIDKDTVNFRENFDGTRKEPVVLPSAVPNILLNGGLGIAILTTSKGIKTDKECKSLSKGLNADSKVTDISIFYRKLSTDLRNGIQFAGMGFSGGARGLSFPVVMNKGDSRTVGRIAYQFSSTAGVFSRQIQNLRVNSKQILFCLDHTLAA